MNKFSKQKLKKRRNKNTPRQTNEPISFGRPVTFLRLIRYKIVFALWMLTTSGRIWLGLRHCWSGFCRGKGAGDVLKRLGWSTDGHKNDSNKKKARNRKRKGTRPAAYPLVIYRPSAVTDAWTASCRPCDLWLVSDLNWFMGGLCAVLHIGWIVVTESIHGHDTFAILWV